MTYTTTFKMAQDGITWGYNAETAKAAVRDTAELALHPL